MEEHFLKGLVTGVPEFRPQPWYNSYGDCIIYQTANEAIVAQRVDELLTVYRSALDNRPIGFQIKGVHAIIEKFGLEALTVESEAAGGQIRTISITLLLLAAYEQGPLTAQRRQAYAHIMPPAEVEAEIPELFAG